MAGLPALRWRGSVATGFLDLLCQGSQNLSRQGHDIRLGGLEEVNDREIIDGKMVEKLYICFVHTVTLKNFQWEIVSVVGLLVVSLRSVLSKCNLAQKLLHPAGERCLGVGRESRAGAGEKRIGADCM